MASRRLIAALLVAAAVAACTTAASAKPAHGSLTVTIELPQSIEPGDVAVVNGTISTSRICASMRQLRAVVVDAPAGFKQASPFYASANGKTYNGVVTTPFQPGTYQVQVIAKRARTSRGRRRGNCAAIASPQVPMTVNPPVG